MGARKTRLEKCKTARAVLESVGNGVSLQSACEAAKVNQATFWRWRQKHKILDRACRRATQSRIAVVEDALYKTAVEGNVLAQIFFLTNRDPENWKDRRALVNNTNVNAITINPPKREFTGSDAELRDKLITEYDKYLLPESG